MTLTTTAAARGPVVVTDGFWPKTLVAVRALGRAGEAVWVGEQTRLAPALWSRHAGGRFRHADPATAPERFLADLERVRERASAAGLRGPAILLPMEETTLVVAAAARARLAADWRLPFASAALLERLRDKESFGELARAHGLPTPRSVVVPDPDAREAALRALDYPLVVKLRRSSGARGVWFVRDRAELDGALATAWRVDPRPILQEELPRSGEAIGVSLLLWRDAAGASPRRVAGFVHRRLREWPVRGGSSTFREAIHDEELVARCAGFLAAQGFIGVAMLEWKRDLRDGALKLLECNPRFWGSLHQAILSGVDFPTLLVRLARGETAAPPSAYSTALRSRAFFPADLLHWWRARPRPAGFFRRDPSVVDEAFDRTDPWPGVARLFSGAALLTTPALRRALARPARAKRRDAVATRVISPEC